MKSFPKSFIWGTATASYQIEGAWLKDCRGLSIWDAFSHTPGKVYEGHTGDRACDHYHRVSKDVALLKELGVKAYRFSIAWPRIQPSGRGAANPEGLRFYNQLINGLIEQGIQPWVTLYHWDLPLALHTELDGWLNPKIADWFGDYAKICFENFGDRVKHWITLNEPWCCAVLGYGNGIHAPGRVSTTEPYIVGHHLLRAHARAVQVYKEKFQSAQQGMIGITNNSDWREPATGSEEDRDAAQRSLEFFMGWFSDPIYFGDYPKVMHQLLGNRLPKWSKEDRKQILGSADFLGLNHYTTTLAAHIPPQTEPTVGRDIFADQNAILSSDPCWKKTDMDWNIVPWGLEKLLKWMDLRYGHPPIYVTENGCAVSEPTKEISLNDQSRVEYLNDYISACHEAVVAGVDLRGYFCWSFMDNFEWACGYTKRFGLYHVDYQTFERTPKKSAKWYRKLIEQNLSRTEMSLSAKE